LPPSRGLQGSWAWLSLRRVLREDTRPRWLAFAQIDQLGRAPQADDSRRVADHHRVARHVVEHHRARADGGAVADVNAADHLAARAQVDAVAQDRRAVAAARGGGGEIAHLTDRAVPTQARPGADEDRSVVADVEAGADLRVHVEMDAGDTAHQRLEEAVREPGEAREERRQGTS